MPSPLSLIPIAHSIGLALLLFAWGCEPAPPPYTLPPDAATPHLFAPKLVSSALPEFATTFSPDGRTVYFNRMPQDRSRLHLYTSTFTEGRWSEPQPMPFSDDRYRDIDPFITLDGQRLYFSSTRPVSGTEPKDYDVWYLEKADDGWSDPINLGAPVNTPDDEIYTTLSRNGNLYFSVFHADNSRALYRAAWQAGAFLPPDRLALSEPDSVRFGNPTISADEQTLIANSGDLGGLGSSDLFISRRTEAGTWGPFENLGAEVNSEFAEFAPAFSPDGAYLFFTSERPGLVGPQPEGVRPPGDLYQVRWRELLDQQ